MLDVLRKLSYLFTRREKRNGVLLFVMMILGAFSEVIGVGAIPAFVGVISMPERLLEYDAVRYVYDLLEMESPQEMVLWAALGLIVIFVVKNAYLAFLVYARSRYTSNRQVTISNRLFRAYLHSPYAFHLQRNTAELLRNTNSEAGAITGSVLLPMMSVLMEFMVLIFIFVLLFAVEEGSFALDSPAIARQAAVTTHDAVTRNRHGHGVGGARSGHRPRRAAQAARCRGRGSRRAGCSRRAGHCFDLRIGGQHTRPLTDAALRASLQEAVDRPAVLEGVDRRDGLHLEGLRHLGVLVDVDLGEHDLPVGLADDLVEDRPQCLAGPAPRRPEVDHHGGRGRAVDHVGLEGAVGHVDGHRNQATGDPPTAPPGVRHGSAAVDDSATPEGHARARRRCGRPEGSTVNLR